MPSAGPGWNVHTIVQFDFRGQIVFQHRCQDKWRFGGNRFVDSLANEELCFQLVRDLASKWSGNLWKNEAPTTMETETIEQLINTRVLYRRVGYDQRVIKLGPNREVIEGGAECERLWHVNHVDGQPVLTLARLDRPTCHLRRDYEGIWRGSRPSLESACCRFRSRTLGLPTMFLTFGNRSSRGTEISALKFHL